jgi:hypothetical protein
VPLGAPGRAQPKRGRRAPRAVAAARAAPHQHWTPPATTAHEKDDAPAETSVAGATPAAWTGVVELAVAVLMPSWPE